MTQESRKERFVRLANKRTNTVLERLRVLGNCSNASLYEYTEEEVNKIFGAIAKELNDVKAKFSNSKQKSSRTFSL
ncbi:hypothetical protein A3C37_04185 [Candidatus Peribacteria bacterium RIFCSPHIGHO2_02_FULL_53_20]|nr:MAG: hypothetical protein A3C37_04185 [Candidatus Peribacteria bacterium RIFCSPHIGHO2_02_FULL_53_20]